MFKKNKRKFRKPSLGIIFGLFMATIPFLLFIHWINVEIRGVKSKGGKVVSGENLPNYQFCESVGDEVKFDEINTGLIPEVISIESIELNLPIVSRPLIKNTWEVKDGVANYAEGTSLINMNSGNIGIYGHDRDYVFSSIKNLSIGDQIFLFSGKFKAIYTIEKSFVSEPENVDVFYPTDEPLLTLVTCDGVFSNQRYIIRAKFDRIEELNCNE